MSTPNEPIQTQPNHALAFLILRLWLAVRAIVTAIEKFGAYRTIQKPLIDPATGMEDPSGAMVDVKVKYYALTNYHGIPPTLRDKFANEPLLPHPFLSAFDYALGPLLLITGIMLLIGLGTRTSLFIQGLIYIALTIGLILLGQNDGVAWLAIHIALVVFALVLYKHNRFAVLKKW